MSGLDWPALCALGMSRLRLQPHEFWALTPAELQLLADPGRPSAMNKGGLSALMQRFPDSSKEEIHD